MRVPILGCVAIAALALFPAAAFADPPQQFLRQAIQGDNSEIMLGRIAERRGDSHQVRDFGRTLVRDHQTARAQAERVASRMGVREGREIAPEARDERGRLSNLYGHRFDREFIRYMIDDHRKDISEFRDEANEHNGPASRLAERQLPTLQKHLDIAQSISNRFDDRMASGRDHDWDHDRYPR